MESIESTCTVFRILKLFRTVPSMSTLDNGVPVALAVSQLAKVAGIFSSQDQLKHTSNKSPNSICQSRYYDNKWHTHTSPHPISSHKSVLQCKQVMMTYGMHQTEWRSQSYEAKACMCQTIAIKMNSSIENTYWHTKSTTSLLKLVLSWNSGQPLTRMHDLSAMRPNSQNDLICNGGSTTNKLLPAWSNC